MVLKIIERCDMNFRVLEITMILLIAFLLTLFMHTDASAYKTFGKHPSSQSTFYSDGYNTGNMGRFNSAFRQALLYWNGLSPFQYYSASGWHDPCSAPDNLSGWFFDNTICGDSFDNALAVSMTWTDKGTGNITDTDIIFNTRYYWGVFNSRRTSPNTFDFRRVATHELGHSLGLGHDNSHRALMNTTYSESIIKPQSDDTNGLRSIYGSPSSPNSPAIQSAYAGTVNTIRTLTALWGNKGTCNAIWDFPISVFLNEDKTLNVKFEGLSVYSLIVFDQDGNCTVTGNKTTNMTNSASGSYGGGLFTIESIMIGTPHSTDSGKHTFSGSYTSSIMVGRGLESFEGALTEGNHATGYRYREERNYKLTLWRHQMNSAVSVEGFTIDENEFSTGLQPILKVSE